MATQPQTDERGFVLKSDREERQRFINERVKLFGLAEQIKTMIAEYDRIIGQAGYPAANRSFEREYAATCRAAYGVFLVDELHEMGVEATDDERDRGNVLCMDERFGVSRSWSEPL